MKKFQKLVIYAVFQGESENQTFAVQMSKLTKLGKKYDFFAVDNDKFNNIMMRCTITAENVTRKSKNKL